MSLRHSDLFDVLPTLEAESFHACVTDPPYGIGFMGKEWDTFKPGTGQTRKLMHPREREAAKHGTGYGKVCRCLTLKPLAPAPLPSCTEGGQHGSPRMGRACTADRGSSYNSITVIQPTR